MANVKITDLTAYTDPASTDVLPIVDVVGDVTKKVSIANIAKNVSAGTVSACGVAADGDPNTGIYWPAADTVALATAGTQRLQIGSTGTVTIPGDLTVQGTTTTITLAAGAAATPSVRFTGSTTTGVFSPGTDQWAVATAGTQRMSIGATGATTFTADVYLSGTGSLGIPTGTTAQRPGTPTAGMIRYNSTLATFEGYGTSWGSIGGGATGGGSNRWAVEHDNTITDSYTISTGKNVISAGPITIQSGAVITVPSNSAWSIV
jgi:hypothetical protein